MVQLTIPWTCKAAGFPLATQRSKNAYAASRSAWCRKYLNWDTSTVARRSTIDSRPSRLKSLQLHAERIGVLQSMCTKNVQKNNVNDNGNQGCRHSPQSTSKQICNRTWRHPRKDFDHYIGRYASYNTRLFPLHCHDSRNSCVLGFWFDVIRVWRVGGKGGVVYVGSTWACQPRNHWNNRGRFTTLEFHEVELIKGSARRHNLVR